MNTPVDKLPPELADFLSERVPDSPFADCPFWFQVNHLFGTSVTFRGEHIAIVGLRGMLTDEEGDDEYPIVLALDMSHAKTLHDMLAIIITHEETGRPWLVPVSDPSE
jgi:hypothetical protein